jgi:glycosyltransferase involved in cell wall biosynthesis
MRIITIVPAYNEEKAITNVVDGAKKHTDVLVVDDGSLDETANLAKNAGAEVLKHTKNIGKVQLLKLDLNMPLRRLRYYGFSRRRRTTRPPMHTSPFRWNGRCGSVNWLPFPGYGPTKHAPPSSVFQWHYH